LNYIQKTSLHINYTIKLYKLQEEIYIYIANIVSLLKVLCQKKDLRFLECGFKQKNDLYFLPKRAN